MRLNFIWIKRTKFKVARGRVAGRHSLSLKSLKCCVTRDRDHCPPLLCHLQYMIHDEVRCFNSTWAATSQTRVQRMMKRKPRQRHRRPINWKYLSHFSHSLYNYRCQPSPPSSTVRWSRGEWRERWWCRPRTAPARGWSGSASTYCRYLRGQWMGSGNTERG